MEKIIRNMRFISWETKCMVLERYGYYMMTLNDLIQPRVNWGYDGIFMYYADQLMYDPTYDRDCERDLLGFSRRS